LRDVENVLDSEDDKLRNYLEALDLTVEDGWTLFKLLDRQETNCVDISDFVDGCLRLKGQAKGIDLARMMYENKWIMEKLASISKELRTLPFRRDEEKGEADDDDLQNRVLLQL